MHRIYHLPQKRLNRNPSIEILDNLFKLPSLTSRINQNSKEIQFQYEDSDFIIQYYENKKRIKLNYSGKNISLPPISINAGL
jgi:hypothetical protein